MGQRRNAARRTARVVRACVEALEGRQLLSGYGEAFTVDGGYSFPGGAAWLPNGGFVTSWKSGYYGYDGHVRMYDAAGNPGATIDLSPGSEAGAVIDVAADGHFVAAYSSMSSYSATGTWVRIFGADGSASGDPMLVATDGYNRDLAVAPDGRFAVAYTRSVPGYYTFGVFVRRYDPNGVPVGPELQVGTYTTSGSAYQPALDIEANGRMTFAWYSEHGGIVGQQVNWDGSFAGDSFAVTGSSGNIWNPRVQVDASGRIAVSWVNPNQGIGLQFFTADRQPVAAAVHMPNSSQSGMHDLAMTPDGRGVLIWVGGGVKGQRFDVSGALKGDVLSISPPTESVTEYPVVAVSPAGQILSMWCRDSYILGGSVGGITYGPGTPPTGIEIAGSSVDEGTSGALIGKLSTVDSDAGETFSYTLAGTHAGMFTVVGDELRTAAALDADTMPTVTIQVQARDASGWQFARLVTITVRNANEAPTSIVLSGAGVVENAPAGTVVGRLLGYDPDAGDVLSYALVAGEGDRSNGLFTIVGDELRTTAPLDHEAAGGYRVRVRVTDAGGKSFEAPITVLTTNVNEGPTRVVLSSSVVQGGRPVGTLVGQLGEDDPDAGDAFAYVLVEGEGATDNGLFQIVGGQLQAAAEITYPGEPRSIRVRVSDAAGLTAETVLTLTIGEPNDPPTATFTSSGGAVPNVESGWVKFTNVQDSPADVAAGFRYSYDFGDDGTFEVTNSTSAEATIPAQYLDWYGATVDVRGRVTDVRGASSEYTAIVTVRDRPEVSIYGESEIGAGQSQQLYGYAYNLWYGWSAVYLWDMDYDGTTFDVDAAGAYAQFSAANLQVGDTRVVALRAQDGDGFASEIGTMTVRVVDAAPTATLVVLGTLDMGRSGRIAFRDVTDSPADVAAGFRYSYDFDGDGEYDLENSDQAEVEVPAEYLDRAGEHLIVGWIADQSGRYSDYEVTVMVRPPQEWNPVYPGLTFRSVNTNGEDSWQTRTEYYEDDDGIGLWQRAESYRDESESHLVKVGTTWCLTAENISTPIPVWDERIAQGKSLRWSNVLVPWQPTGEEGFGFLEAARSSGSVSKVRTGSVVLPDGTQFDGAMLVKQQMTLKAPAMYGQYDENEVFREGRVMVTSTVTTQTWYVRGIGPVKYEQTTLVKTRGAVSVAPQSSSAWGRLAYLPEWAQFYTVRDGRIYVEGTDGADRITVRISHADDGDVAIVNRNGMPDRVSLTEIERIVVLAGDGNDKVDAGGIGMMVEVDGGAGNDTITGGNAADLLAGGDGADRLYGGAGDDSLEGGAGKDLLQGDGGDDDIEARDGSTGDRIIGGAGTDTARVDPREKTTTVESRQEGEEAVAVVKQRDLVWAVELPRSVLDVAVMDMLGEVRASR